MTALAVYCNYVDCDDDDDDDDGNNNNNNNNNTETIEQQTKTQKQKIANIYASDFRTVCRNTTNFTTALSRVAEILSRRKVTQKRT